MWWGVVLDIDDVLLFGIVSVIIGLTCDGLVDVDDVDIDVVLDDANMSPPTPAITSVASTRG